MPKPFDLGAMNSSMGEEWVERWCRTCYRGENKCRILAMALGCGEQPELIYDDETRNPICTRYKNKANHVVKHRPNKNQMDIEL